jgi:hypothetical protein
MIILHIGLPKSGSTTIQSFLEANQEPLRTLSIDYTRVGRHRQKAHHTLSFELKGWNGRMNPRAGRLAEVAGDARNSGHRLTIMSSELLSDLKPHQIRFLAQALAPAEQPFRIVVIMRDQLSAIVSLYSQKTRYGKKTFDFDQFFSGFIKSMKFDQFDVVDRWVSVFGWESMRVRVLNEALLVNGDLIDDFFTAIDVDPHMPQIISLQRQPNVNESAGWKTSEAVRALFAKQGMVESWRFLSKLADSNLSSSQRHLVGATAEEVAQTFGWTKDKGLYLTRSQAQICLDSYGNSVRKLNKHLPVAIPEPLSLEARGFVERQFLPDASHIGKQELGAFYTELERRLID